MRILLLNVDYKYSSTGKIVYDLYTKLNNKGYQVAVCYGRGEKIKDQNVFKFGLDLETYLHAALARITGINGYYSFFSTQRLLRFIKKFKPDVIHIHELHAYFVNHGSLLKYIKKHNIKVVWTFHCEYMYTGKCGHAYECKNWQAECGKCPAVKGYPKSIFVDATKMMFRHKKSRLQDLDMTIVTPSQWLADRVKLSFLGDKKINVIHNGIDTSVFCSSENKQILEEFGIPSDKKMILFVAPNLNDPNKGAKWIVELSKKLQRQDVVYVLVGEGNVEAQRENFVFTGKIKNQNKLAALYSQANVLISCSKRETFPTTCLEAQCCGTPVAGFDAGGTRETILFGENNIVPYGEIDSLVERIEELLSMGVDKQNLACIAEAVYSRDKMLNNYLDIYDQM